MMMDILMYLFETYIHSDAELQVDQDELEDELLRAGFHQKDIYKALNWLEELAALQQTDAHSAIATSATTSMRSIPRKRWKDWISKAEAFSCSLNRSKF